MKSKAVLFTLLTIMIASTGLVWAAGDTRDESPQAQPTGQIEQAPETTPENPSAAEVLESLAPEQAEKGACCAVDCFDAYLLCLDDCGPFNQACRLGCRNDKRACLQAC